MDTVESMTTATSEGSSQGPSTPRLPVEVCGRIIDHVAMRVDFGCWITEGQLHVVTLSACALVCRDWYYLTWHHLRRRIHLRDRKDVLSLYKTLCKMPRLREFIQEVIISGASPGKRQPIRHLGVFAVMLVGKLPRLWRFTIEDAEWTTGSVRMEDIRYLAAFSCIGFLTIRNVILSSVSLLSHLILALPRLTDFWCFHVSCLQKQQVPPASLPLNCANLEWLNVKWVAPEVEDLFVQISRASRVRLLELAVDSELDPSSAASRSQTLLDASCTSAERVMLNIGLGSPVRDDTIDTIVGQHYNLSRYDHLQELEIRLHPFAAYAWPWIPHIVSRITSKHFQAMSVMFRHATDYMADDWDRMLAEMEQDDVLTRLDSILQGKHFSSTVASKSCHVCIGVDNVAHNRQSADEYIIMESALREWYDRLDVLVSRKMSYSYRQGLLSTVHNIQEHASWRHNVYRSLHPGTHAQQMSEGFSHGPRIRLLPAKVCERIIDHIAMGMAFDYRPITKGDPRLASLTSCALVCRDWYYLTWSHLRRRIHLRDRKDVLSLSKTLRERPRLREVVQEVIISGDSPGERRPIRHLGTFAAMLAGKLPRLSMLSIEDAEWTIGSVRTEDIRYLAAFSSIQTLFIRNATLSSVAQLSRLVSALPQLRCLWCDGVACFQEQQVSQAFLPLNRDCANLESLQVAAQRVAPAVEDLFLQISRTSRVRDLWLVVDYRLDTSSGASRSQNLLDASSTSAETLALDFDFNISVRDGTIDSVVERHYNLSHYDHLWKLEIYLYHPFTVWPWVPHIVSLIGSKHFQAMSVMFILRTDHAADDLHGLLTTMEQDDVMGRLDSILQEEQFSSTLASKGVCLGIDHENGNRIHDRALIAKDSTLGKQYDRWDKLVARKMPHSRGRGISSIAYGFRGLDMWRQDMQWQHATMPMEQTNAGGEAQLESQDDEGARGDTD